MDMITTQLQKRPLVIALAALLLGIIIGFILLPIRFVNGGPEHLAERDLKLYLNTLNISYSADGNADRIRHALCYWDKNDPEAGARAVEALGYPDIVGVLRAENGCAAFIDRVAQAGVADGAAAPASGRSLGRILGFLVLLLLVLGALVLFGMQRRNKPAPAGHDSDEMAGGSPPEPRRRERRASSSAAAAATTVTSGNDPVPLGGFQTTYQRGDDNYDKSFIIENANGDFLGECGVSISEASSADGMRNVTAFEIWLFDKNDTHTVTKVLLSNHAHDDDGLRAKLAPRGEPVLAEPGRTIALETASLIINAEVAELGYHNASPERSIFEQLTIDLAAWVKSDDAGSSRPDDMLAF